MSSESSSSAVAGGGPPLRIGILGAARIAPGAVIQPINDNADLAAKAQIVRTSSNACEMPPPACIQHTGRYSPRASWSPTLRLVVTYVVTSVGERGSA
eukprot:COSAG02_NODE_6252_length_3699_cov_1.530556_3_plen_98_part_00